MFKIIKDFIREEDGASAVEYGLIVGLIAIAILATVIAIGGNLNTLFGGVDTALENAAGNAPAGS